MPRIGKGPVAFLADKGLFLGVLSQMILEATLMLEDFVAIFAVESDVDARVRRQGGASEERCVAFAAPELSLARQRRVNLILRING